MDILGLDVIYVQAKKWDGAVGRPEIHKFAGTLQGKRSKKGIFITTGTFSKITFIDGNELSRLMVEHNVGIRDKKINSAYFTDEGID